MDKQRPWIKILIGSFNFECSLPLFSAIPTHNIITSNLYFDGLFANENFIINQTVLADWQIQSRMIIEKKRSVSQPIRLINGSII
ncbi:hypothetical protein NH340_JMT01733 [Sarcoptes scabiei]|nr:hypothetical protein NH340_JMT01733 [Sarcoptes scabiei]